MFPPDILPQVLQYLNVDDRKRASLISWSWRRAYLYPSYMKTVVLRLLSMESLNAMDYEFAQSLRRIRIKFGQMPPDVTDHEAYLHGLLLKIAEKCPNLEDLNFKRCPIFRRAGLEASRTGLPYLTTETYDEMLYRRCKPIVEQLRGRLQHLTLLNLHGCLLSKSILQALLETYNSIDSLSLANGTMLAWQPPNQIEPHQRRNSNDSDSDYPSESEDALTDSNSDANSSAFGARSLVENVHGGELGWDPRPISSDWLVEQIGLNLKRLSRLNLKHSGFEWPALRKLADLADQGILLEELRIGDTEYRTNSREPDAVLAYFVSKQTNLRTLDIQTAVFSGVNVEYLLDKLPLLSSLQVFTVFHNRSRFEAYPLHKISLSKFVKLRIGCLCSSAARGLQLNFRNLSVDETETGPPLESLHLRHFRFQSGDVSRAISALVHLQELNLSHCQTISDDDMQLLASTCTRLKKLWLICLDITDATFASCCLTKLNRLELLNISSCKKITAAAYGSFKFAHLRRLLLKKVSGVSDASLALIADGCRNLEKLSIIDSEKQLSDAGIVSALPSLIRLRSFYVVCDTVTDRILHHNPPLPSCLRKLTVNTLRVLPASTRK